MSQARQAIEQGRYADFAASRLEKMAANGQPVETGGESEGERAG